MSRFAMAGSRPEFALPDVPHDPATGPDVIAELRRVHAESVAYWDRYSTAEFFHRPGPGVWSPADQVRHLTKSVRAVVRGLEMPRFALLVFGVARRPSRSSSAVRDDYRARLAAGVQAGRFAPRALEGEAHSEDNRVRIMAAHAAASSWPLARPRADWRQGARASARPCGRSNFTLPPTMV